MRRKDKSKTLTWDSQPIEAPEGWLGLVKLRDYYDFIQDDTGDFHEEIVVENVRGFLMKTPVNDSITATLANPLQNAEFWLLNNGITILAKDAKHQGFRQMNVSDPQVVNGLQTSRQIHKHYHALGGSDINDERRLLVRVIKVVDDPTRDQIIRATNSQNKMASEMLRSTDSIHLKIEEIFGQYGLFYDRRKGYYKDQGKPPAQIVSMREVLQAMLAITLRRPGDARGRPADYLKDDLKYDEVFKTDKYNVLVYLRTYSIVKRVWKFLNDEHSDHSDHFLNIGFYISMFVACVLTENALAPPSELLKVDANSISDAILEESFQVVAALYLKNQHGGLVAADRVAKGLRWERNYRII